MNYTKRFRFAKHIVLCAVVIILVSGLPGCQSPKYYPEPEKYLIKELANKKIIMLGDFGHASAYPYQSLMALLNEWREQVKTGESKDTDITLVLEGDDEVINVINSYISSGDLKKVFNYCAPYNSMETLEFYSDLRSFVKSIDEINQKRGSGDKISFDLLGGEAFNKLDNPDFLNKTNEEQGRFFVTVRDSLISEKIISSLKTNIKKKAIVFYGNAHLDKSLSDKKSIVGDLTEKTVGYYFAHHLKKYFGYTEVLTVNPKIISIQEQHKNRYIENVTEKTFFIYAKDYDNDYSAYDSYLILREPLTTQHSLGQIFSLNTLNASLEKANKLKGHISNEAILALYNRAIESLKLITGQNFSEISDWEKWIKQANYDGFKRLDSPEFAQMIEDKYFNDQTPQFKNQLVSLGVSEELIKSVNSREDWKSNRDKILADIKYVNAIGVNCVGTPEEQAKAKQYLVSVTGKNFQNPADYIKYYRSSVFNVSY